MLLCLGGYENQQEYQTDLKSSYPHVMNMETTLASVGGNGI
jgi:hypothetical protein